MRSAQVTIRAVAVAPADAFDRVKDFAAYPALSPVVRSVRVTRADAGTEHSEWEVYFRNGVLRWSETDTFDRAGLTIAFAQDDGDFAEFSGVWRIRGDGEDSLIDFFTEFDFGIPSLAGILDPVAERVFRETIGLVVTGLFAKAEIVGDEALVRAVELARERTAGAR
ncbi:SRPBCC family protein [Streptomyces roseirectus]|uniref:SRPBCC family protein n=1 Tax=Streptomyces roseirectus TaxID=2768066 RepID=A0A7H0I836_9ACTN|nr:SRPBCC family protein [Streptomyces roseirectus]QNP68952.1 SRPBCC family protein [Streptomyces roseirectus]